jgi:hypothetical protein
MKILMHCFSIVSAAKRYIVIFEVRITYHTSIKRLKAGRKKQMLQGNDGVREWCK